MSNEKKEDDKKTKPRPIIKSLGTIRVSFNEEKIEKPKGTKKKSNN